MMKYGLPYKGSKSRVAGWVVDQLPPAPVLVDLFAGGCAITHCALLSGKFGRVIANDIGPWPGLFLDAIAGKYHDETRWISREDFQRLKDTDPYVALIWSFGNNCKDYLYCREIEPWKHALHLARVFGDRSGLEAFGIHSNGSRRDIVRHMDEYKAKYIAWYVEAMRLERLESLERLQSPERLESLERLERLETSRLDYRDVSIPEGAVVYCDIPYRGTDGYRGGFDHDAFYEWALSRPFPVYISEYDMPDTFERVVAVNLQSTLVATGTTKRTEGIFIPKHQEHVKTTLF